jgi:hypothetical protein
MAARIWHDHCVLDRFAAYFNQQRVHAGLGGQTPFERSGKLHVNRQILITSLGDRTAPASSTRQVQRNRESAMDTSLTSIGASGAAPEDIIHSYI